MLGMRGYTPEFVNEAKKARFQGNAVVQTLIFFAVYFVSSFASGIIASIAMLPKILSEMAGLDFTSPTLTDDIMDVSMQVASDPFIMLVSLFVTVITTALVIVYCKFIEKRSLGSMGFYKRKALPSYLVGIIIGFGLYSIALAINYFTGAVEYNGVVMTGGIGMILLFALGFFFQGMSEEVLLRGYFMNSLSIKSPAIVAVLLNSVLFGAMHFQNPGFGFLAFFNIVLFGVFMSVYMLKTGNIWGACAIHSTWNFVQGNIYGGQVSGLECSSTVFSFTQNESMSVMNGGAFGFEGGLAVTIVLIAAIAVTIAVKPKETEGTL